MFPSFFDFPDISDLEHYLGYPSVFECRKIPPLGDYRSTSMIVRDYSYWSIKLSRLTLSGTEVEGTFPGYSC